MAKKKRSEKHTHRPQARQSTQPGNKFSFRELKLPRVFLLLIVLLTVIIYLPTFTAGFVWDDDNYIRNNELIRTFDIGGIFSDYVIGNYHPITVLVLAVEYQLFGLNETWYHLVNVLLHAVNVLLVYNVILLLSKKEIASLDTGFLEE